MASSISITGPSTMLSETSHIDQTSHQDIIESLDEDTIDVSITTEVTSSFAENLSLTSTPNTSSKHPILPLLQVQSGSKLPHMQNSKSNNIVVNTLPQIQIQNLNGRKSSQNFSLSANISVQGNQGVILSKPQQLVIQKPPVGVDGVPVFTVVKPLYKSQDHNKINKISLTKVKSENIQIGTNPPTITTNGQKYVLTSMPKMRNSKIALIPFSAQSNKIRLRRAMCAKRRLQNVDNNTVTVLCDEDEASETIEKDDIEMINAEKSSEDKTYELSIVEDSKDVSYTITIPEGTEKLKNTTAIKEAPKLPKHGVSILKRSFNLFERKPDKPRNSLIINPIANSISTVSDTSTKEVKIGCSNNIDIEKPVVVQPPTHLLQKSEGRRRKSQFLCRKDYDELEVIRDDKPIMPKLVSHNEVKLLICEDEVKREVERIEIDLIKNDDQEYDAFKALDWVNGIGTLPGTELKFEINEYGILEFLTDDDYARRAHKKDTKAKEIKSALEEVTCVACGCFGMRSDFISASHCSYDCLSTAEGAMQDREIKVRKKKRKGYVRKSEMNNINNNAEQKNDKESTPSDGDISNDNSQDKYLYPWTSGKKGFSWAKYLEHVKGKAAPVKLFKDPFPYTRNGFRPGMKLEGIDPLHPSYFCVLTVAEVCGYRMRLHFDGYPENYDFWTNADSMNVFPAGWCEKHGHTLHPPPNYADDFNWNNYLKQTKSTAAPKQLFANRQGNAICPNGFRIGMKLEAVDRKNTSLVCVATVADMMDNRILVHFDSWDDIYDYWADPTSPYIHPVGWCDKYGHNLTPPNESFTWETYLKETKATAAPSRAFKIRPSCGFKRGMRLECVDKRVPQIIRVATVDDVRDHQICISFDGWPVRYSYWVDDDCTDIHPIGWCHKTGHPLEPPLTPDDVYDFLECPTVGCRGQGHIQGPIFMTHSNTINCPYSDENIDLDHNLPDRLLSPDTQLEEVVPVSREPREKHKVRLGRPPKMPRLDPEIKVEKEWSEGEELPKPKRKYRSFESESPKEKTFAEVRREAETADTGFVTVEQEQAWEKHARYLTEFIKYNNLRDLKRWTKEEVAQFVNSLPDCKGHAINFVRNNVDGQALLMLNQQDIIDILNIKLGPAIKVYNSILLLRKRKGYPPSIEECCA